MLAIKDVLEEGGHVCRPLAFLSSRLKEHTDDANTKKFSHLNEICRVGEVRFSSRHLTLVNVAGSFVNGRVIFFKHARYFGMVPSIGYWFAYSSSRDVHLENQNLRPNGMESFFFGIPTIQVYC